MLMTKLGERQHEAIEKLVEVLSQDNSVKAIFLKGSIARGQGDHHSDVDMYCIIGENAMGDFLKKRLQYLEAYKPLIYWSESNFVGPQIVGVYDDGLHIDLYSISLDVMKNTDEMKVLYDPDNLLKDYKFVKPEPSAEEIARVFNGFTFSLLEFEAAYCRKDLLWASRLGSHMLGDLSIILSHLYDHKKPYIGLKHLHLSLEPEMKEKLVEANNLIGPNELPHGIVKMVEIADDVLTALPKEIYKHINKGFFRFMANKINQL